MTMVVCAEHMEDAMSLDNGLTLVVGLGRTGLSCVRYLIQQGALVEVTDSRSDPPGLEELQTDYPKVTAHLGGFDADVFASAQRIVLSPGVSLSEPAVRAVVGRGVPVLGDVELFARAVTAPVLAVTGSNGKSTVATMLHAMGEAAGLKVGLGGNVGTPVLDLLEGPEPDLFVLELSSFQLETTDSLEPAVATVLNLTQDHMDRYDSVEAYAAAKRRILSGSGTMVLNADDPVVAQMARPDRSVIWFTIGHPAGDDDYGIRERDTRPWLYRGREPIMPASALGLAGAHNHANALAALAMGAAAGFSNETMVQALRSFTGLPHRMQLAAQHHGIRWFNDSKATNTGAALAAIDGCDGPVVLIAGGDAKGADFSGFADSLAAAGKVKHVVLLGQDAVAIDKAIGDRLPTIRVESMDAAVEAAASVAQSGDTVLLAPACSSLDMFRDFAHRGEVFTAAVTRRTG